MLEDGTNTVGKATKDSTPDVRIGGIGVSPEHCQLVYKDSNNSLQLLPNEMDPNKFKTMLNGQEVDRKVQVAHGDKILFGNHNLFVIVFPGQEVTEEMKDFDEIMSSMNKDAIEAFSGGSSNNETNKELEKMRRNMDEEKKKVEDKLKAEQKKLMEEKKRLVRQADAERKKLMEEYKAQSKDSEERVKLQEQLKKQQEESEKLRKEQKKKEKEFELEKKKALQEIQDKKRQDHSKEVELMQRKDLEHRLNKLIPQLNEVNEICQNLGRYTYNYTPHIITDVLPDGKRIPKLVVKAYPDRDKDFYNTLSYDEFEDKIYRIREKWENIQYDIENGDFTGEMDLEPDENEADVFGLSIQNENKLIGSVYIFCDSLSSLLETNQDTAPILNSKGETKGHLNYSLVPSAIDEKGEKLNLNHYEGVMSLLNKTIQVEFNIQEAKGIPEKYCNEVYCEYTWVDEAGEKFETKKTSNSKDPRFKYTKNHDLFISNYIAENLQYSILMVSLYGKLSDEKMLGILNDLQLRPMTSALLKDKSDNGDAPFYDDKGGAQNIMNIDEEESSQEGETGPKKKESKKDMESKMKDLEKKLKKIQKENDKLKQNPDNRKSSSCCIIF